MVLDDEDLEYNTPYRPQTTSNSALPSSQDKDKTAEKGDSKTGDNTVVLVLPDINEWSASVRGEVDRLFDRCEFHATLIEALCSRSDICDLRSVTVCVSLCCV